MSGIWAIVPVKEFSGAKQRLAGMFAPEFRRGLAAVMLEDVLAALTGAKGLAGVAVVTVDPTSDVLARRMGARVMTMGARDGHTGAVTAAVRVLAAEGASGMLTIPGDVPGVTAAEIETVLAAHGAAPAFTIVPAHDSRGSNTIVASPPDLVPLAFGNDSFLPHLAAARERGLEPRVLRLSGIGLDIDNPEDLLAFAARRWPTRTTEFLDRADALRALAS
ncbi:MAG TPA: 2-phospho-L-lactate guanylyltransferase [Stellaceae bacterium]|nr:2-phospho-L-lactate guanylyltransferase [Stellaceae bacterium]